MNERTAPIGSNVAAAMLSGLALFVSGCGLLLDLDPPDEDLDASQSGIDAEPRVDAGRFDAGRFDAAGFDAAGLDGGPRVDASRADAMRPDAPSCIATVEICNGIDDDCDGSIDEVDVGAALCPGLSRCVVGSCECPAPATDCGGACVDTLTDTRHCGGCGTGCAGGRGCFGGGCNVGWLDVTAGGSHTCALATGGRVLCWGRNDMGQLGDGSTTPRFLPRLTSISDAIAIDAGAQHTCAIRVGGVLSCWGAGAAGQLGDGGMGSRLGPVTPAFTMAPEVRRVSAGPFGSAIVTSTAVVWAWGGNGDGQLGDGSTTTPRLAPVLAGEYTGAFADVQMGTFHSCALTTSGEVRCIGGNGNGERGLGVGMMVAPTEASVVLGLVALQISSNGRFTCARTGGSVTCWGANDVGQCGVAGGLPVLSPSVVPGLTRVDHISAGAAHACAVADGAVYCWGSNERGQLGRTAVTSSPLPMMVPGITNALRVSAGGSHTCVVTGLGEILCWGRSDQGQLGVTSAMGADTPSPVRLMMPPG